MQTFFLEVIPNEGLCGKKCSHKKFLGKFGKKSLAPPKTCLLLHLWLVKYHPLQLAFSCVKVAYVHFEYDSRKNIKIRNDEQKNFLFSLLNRISVDSRMGEFQVKHWFHNAGHSLTCLDASFVWQSLWIKHFTVSLEVCLCWKSRFAELCNSQGFWNFVLHLCLPYPLPKDTVVGSLHLIQSSSWQARSQKFQQGENNNWLASV